ncbi:putative UDP-glucuronate:xylan alpha-glucuronosyltransferase 3 [Amborella trichopoda]|uniref:Hexosyltransferase n=1 Tax=Amborella trichopoda TaxID=13333 RepID=U5DCH5_AMBTC|nr:putative UDP-glucuronate:xylan alpha-glucuronosyltransferase 3 [Amborella trichopoda]XP_011628566.1 putative UDP-glucuronate:xylan alpha-glucuronosyltransferase 3 [Amborella trichopoda]XP_011628567.1 putative UDP-glucuronate:xylan alpha-glucuronosyltransferase 3 [Amborella trichopoda]XP_020531767.1 putative UDP-glucuronate:xylan alpha-glucuronosyltransferase 3 [Amborella trichopoda]XP_020531768.1 putative UDP-glucuronate:xylan alpha-glucuronosyltransferase 3 [Amborella trichopoda]XP_0205317|eukprot:XP_006858468.1 putative UDP-glucuronate:xylan alpha-glucuronosyltransferase 3 [Amborella trichopoda]
MRGLSGALPSPVEPRHRQAGLLDSGSKRRIQRLTDLEDTDKAIFNPVQDRNSSCKLCSLKLVLVLIICGTFLTLLHSPTFHHGEQPLKTRYVDLGWPWETSVTDDQYVSRSEVSWSQISKFLDQLSKTREKLSVGLLNFNSSELHQWKKLTPGLKPVKLHIEHAKPNITWDSLYPEWIDEEEFSEIPVCPSLPLPNAPRNLKLDLIAVKLPCKRVKNWSRDVARLHLQLAAAKLAVSMDGSSSHILLVSECWPIPNLFTCKELIFHEGNTRVYRPDKVTMVKKLGLPVGSCELAVPLKAKDRIYAGNPRREAYATILHSAHIYVCGAIAAAQSIRLTGSTRDLVILVDETISSHHRSGLAAAGWKIRTIQRIRNPKAEKDAYNEWNYSKFRLWQLTDYDKIIFIDADLLILRNIDFLFEMPEITATGNNATLFNSGVMVLEPSNCTFNLLMDHINEIESYNGGDQGYLNEIFTWWHRIPKRMNFLKHFWAKDEEEKEYKTRLFAADPPELYVLHYLGLKPWLCFRDYDCNWNVDILQEFASDIAHWRWWKVHDMMPEKLQRFCLLRSKQKAGLEWDRRQAEKAAYDDGHWKRNITDPRLKICFEEFCFWESMLWHWGETNWTDDATPVTTTVPTASLSSL